MASSNFTGLLCFLHEIILNHRKAEIAIYLLHEPSMFPRAGLPHLRSEAAALRLAGITVEIFECYKWNDLVSKEAELARRA